ncbi:DNA-binding GntR family transcriptional regulator [Murinocardiopsis flavida]|uniref:DNA-binding GntR family transcriptional regulator n=1 Tax=Murinocardiopsis flavida TaxID=645275 RepID=A0A2P8DL81_9ACTN|nr:GntR family transcriptional regulator [Murinocardiopsis flavida]PSK97983.1 DNA-binding GntR family transcriptional regulator [Murinocardiopsis flavida]
MGGHATKNEHLAVQIREAVRSGELAPGALYSAQDLAARFDVSRTPVREALLRLADAGLVRIERNRGARILRADSHDIVEACSLRLLLEPPAARVAALRMTERTGRQVSEALAEMRATADDTEAMFAADHRFHDAILRASGNHRLADLVAGLRETITLHGRRTVPGRRDSGRVLAEHEAITAALTGGDADASEELMRDHLRATSSLLLADDAPATAEWTEWAGAHPPEPDH